MPRTYFESAPEFLKHQHVYLDNRYTRRNKIEFLHLNSYSIQIFSVIFLLLFDKLEGTSWWAFCLIPRLHCSQMTKKTHFSSKMLLLLQAYAIPLWRRRKSYFHYAKYSAWDDDSSERTKRRMYETTWKIERARKIGIKIFLQNRRSEEVIMIFRKSNFLFFFNISKTKQGISVLPNLVNLKQNCLKHLVFILLCMSYNQKDNNSGSINWQENNLCRCIYSMIRSQTSIVRVGSKWVSA